MLPTVVEGQSYWLWASNCWKACMMKPWQVPVNKALSKGGKRRNKERRLKSKLKRQNPKWVTKGQKNKWCSEAPTSCMKHIRKKKGWETWKTLSLEEASLATTMCFKIETTWALCKTTHTLCLKKAHKTFEGGSHVPLANYTTLAHQWKKSSTCWCKQPKTSMARRRNVFTKCQS